MITVLKIFTNFFNRSWNCQLCSLPSNQVKGPNSQDPDSGRWEQVPKQDIHIDPVIWGWYWLQQHWYRYINNVIDISIEIDATGCPTCGHLWARSSGSMRTRQPWRSSGHISSNPVEKGILEEVLKDPQPSFQLTREIGAYLINSIYRPL